MTLVNEESTDLATSFPSQPAFTAWEMGINPYFAWLGEGNTLRVTESG